MTSDTSENPNIQAAGSAEPAAVACEANVPANDPMVAQAGASYRRDGQCRIIVDSCADFAPEVARALGVEVVHFSFVMNDGEHADDLWKSMTPHEFYERMRNGEHATTAAVTPGHYLEVFERAAASGVPAGLPRLYPRRVLERSTRCARRPRWCARRTRATSSTSSTTCARLPPPSCSPSRPCARWATASRPASSSTGWRRPATTSRAISRSRASRPWPAAAASRPRLPRWAASSNIKPELSYDLNGALMLRGMCRGREALRAIISDFKENYIRTEEGVVTHMPIFGIVRLRRREGRQVARGPDPQEPGCADIPIIHSSVSPVIGAHVGPAWSPASSGARTAGSRSASRPHRQERPRQQVAAHIVLTCAPRTSPSVAQHA